jgi:AraC family transcriptional regulator
VGIAPHQYLTRRQVERAKHLLGLGDRPIAAIAPDCGFCHQAHFDLHPPQALRHDAGDVSGGGEGVTQNSM